jgi:hypothetical protein
MRWSIRVALLVLGFGSVSFAQTPVDIQPVKKLERSNTLGTCAYAPIEKEKAFYAKLKPKEQATGSFMEPYSIRGKEGKFVSWFAIVRGISQPEAGEKKITLLLEHKYFDGLTDCHIMMVSQSGDGDFRAKLEGDAEAIPALSLVRVYGTVVEEKDKVPEVAVEYIRVWPWLTFTLTDLGAGDHNNPRWTKFCKPCKGGRIYNPYPTEAYYRAILGEPEEFGLHLDRAK